MKRARGTRVPFQNRSLGATWGWLGNNSHGPETRAYALRLGPFSSFVVPPGMAD